MNIIDLKLQHPIGLAVVTGANGHLGANLVRVLLALGVPVRAVVRPNRPHPALDGLPLEICEQDVRNPVGWDRALDNCTHLFHCAALFSFQNNMKEQILSTSIEGTRNLCYSATNCKTLEKFIYTSSTAAIGYSYHNPKVLTETDWNDHTDSPYVTAKTVSEKLVSELATAHSLPIIIVNPAVIIGFYDYRITPSMQLVLQPLLHRLPFTIPGGMTVVDATDCAIGHILSADRGKIGERYILGGDSVTVTDFYRTVSEYTGIAPPRYSLGKMSGSALISLLTIISKLVNQPVLLTKQRFLDVYERYGFFSSEKAKNEIGFTPQPAKAAIAHAIAWLIIGNAIPQARLKQLHLQEDILRLLPSGWKPGNFIQLQKNTTIR